MRSSNSVTDVFEHRAADFGPTEEQQMLLDATRGLFKRSLKFDSRPRNAAQWYDPNLQLKLAELGLLALSLATEGTGDGHISDAGLVAEEVGRRLAPVAFAETIAVAPLLGAALQQDPPEHGATQLKQTLSAIVGGTAVVALASAPASTPQVLPGGAVASHAVFLDGDQLVLVPLETSDVSQIATLGSVSAARWIPRSLGADAAIIAVGEQARYLYAHAVERWHTLAAAQLVGLADRALRASADYVQHRYTRGVAIGALQAIAHPLADVHVAIESARNLVRKAAWYADNEPQERPELPIQALGTAIRASREASVTTVHVQGGYGLSLESEVAFIFGKINALAHLAGRTDALDVQTGRLMFERLARSSSTSKEGANGLLPL